MNSKTLLDSPYEETQIKDRAGLIVLRVVVIALLFYFLIVSCVFNFTAKIYSSGFNYYLASNLNPSKYHNAKSCDLLVIKSYNDDFKMKNGDIVFYETNAGTGSGELISCSKDVCEILINGDQTKYISEKFVVGKQIKSIRVLGFPIAFLDSYYGIASCLILLLAYSAYITFSRVNYENTVHGRKLYRRFRKEQKEEKERKKILKLLNNDADISLKITNMLEGKYNENKERFLKFDYETKGSLKEKYKYLLSEIHEAYLIKEKLTKTEKRQITSIIELVFDAGGIDEDMEYMLIDLALKTKLEGFEEDVFFQNAVEFVQDTEHKTYLLNFASLLYVLIYKNGGFDKENVLRVANVYDNKIQELDDSELKDGTGLVESISKLLK